MPLVPARQSGLAAWMGRRWRIAALAAVIVTVAVVMLTGGHRPSMGLTGRGSSVVSVAFSPDSKIIAAADEEGFIYLWQTATGQRITTLRNPRGDINAIAFSPDGKLLAAGDSVGGNTTLWRIVTGQRVATLHDPVSQAFVSSVAFSPDGKTLAVLEGIGDGNGTIYLWSVAASKTDAILADPRGYDIDSAAFSPDGKVLATGDDLDAYQPTSTPARTYLWDVSWLP